MTVSWSKAKKPPLAGAQKGKGKADPKDITEWDDDKIVDYLREKEKQLEYTSPYEEEEKRKLAKEIRNVCFAIGDERCYKNNRLFHYYNYYVLD